MYSLKYSGAEIMYVDAASLFQERGCKLSVVATAEDIGEFAPKFKEAGYQVYHLPYPSRSHFIDRLFYLAKFSIFLKKNKFDVVHIHANKTMFGMAFCAWVAGKRSVYTSHNVFPTRLLTRPLHIAIRWIAKRWWNCKFQTISDSVYKNELKRFKNKTIKIYNWYGSNRFFPGNTEEKQKFRKEIGIDKDASVVISVGGCSPIKRHSEIIKALALIKKEIPNIIYLHLGKGESEEEERKLVKQLNLFDNVKFVGNQNDVRKYLIASDIYVMTSKFEGMPITAIEVMGCKIPTILYDVPGLRDFNNQKEITILIKEDFNVLAQKIVSLYKNEMQRDKYTLVAKDFVDKNYSMKINSKKICQLYIDNKEIL